MGREVAETTCSINSALGPGTANEHTVQWFEGESFEGEERSRGPSEVDNNQLGAIIESNALITNYMTNCQRIHCRPFYSHSAFEANWKGEKAQ